MKHIDADGRVARSRPPKRRVSLCHRALALASVERDMRQAVGHSCRRGGAGALVVLHLREPLERRSADASGESME